MGRNGNAGAKQNPDELHVDASYRNKGNKSKGKDPEDEFYNFFTFAGKSINNSAGFKARSLDNGSTKITDCCFCLLVTNFGETEWPDSLDSETGLFTYYGDNREAGKGKQLNKTPIGGNHLLEVVFERLHDGDRQGIPPFLCFETYPGAGGTFARFLGLAVPGGEGISSLDDLVAVWRRTGKDRFQNYRAIFTILKEEVVKRSWLEEIAAGAPAAMAKDCPPAFARWVESGKYEPLTTPPTRVPRKKAEQLPRTQREHKVLNAVRTLDDRQFEHFTKALLRLMDPRFFDLEVTRRVRDEGRDVFGKYRVGHEDHWVSLDICAEAKHWKNSIGVTQMMRLISRIKHRDFGIFVTTSHFNQQVQKEVTQDGHPVVLVSGGDIARILIARELEGEGLERWLDGIRSIEEPD